MPLTDMAIKKLQPKDKAYKNFDGQGLYLEVRPTGSKHWRLRFKFNGKTKLLSLGQYPAIGLKQARELRDEARVKIARGIDPALEKQQTKKKQKQESEKAASTFRCVAEEWYEVNKPSWSAEYAKMTWSRLENNLLPWLGDTPIAEIEPPLLLEQIRRIEKRGAKDTAQRVTQLAGAIFRFAIAAGKATRNPAADIKGALKREPVRHFPALTEPEDIKQLLRAIDGYEHSFLVKTALQVSALTFLRPGELRKGTWDEIDMEQALWKIPAQRIKGRRDHLVPLARQTIKLLQDLRPVTEGTKGNYIFPGERMNGRPMSENTVNVALRSLGFSRDQMCAHGFRTMASTRLHESGLWDSRVIELQLAHVDKNIIRGIYNRAIYLEERRKMMDWWANYLDSLREGAKLIPFHAAATHN